MKEIAVYYDAASDYLHVRVPHGISGRQLALVARAAFDIDAKRYAASSGDKRDVLGKRIAAFRAGRVRQVICHQTGDTNLFGATVGTGRIISIGH